MLKSLYIKLVLIVVGGMFAGLGLWFCIDPTVVLEALGYSERPLAGLIDTRAFYGGFELMFGVFLLVAAFKPTWHVPTLTMLVLVSVGITVGRFAGLSIEGHEPQMLQFAIVESGMTLLAVIALGLAYKAE